MLQSRLTTLVLVLFLGALMPLSFAPFNIAFIAPLALAGLLFVARNSPPKRAFKLGLLFGFGMFSWGIWWIRISLIEFGGAPVAVGVFLTLLLALYLALYYAILSYAMVRVSWRLSWKALLLLPALGMLLEFVRAQLFTGFPWLALGYSLTDSPLSGYLFPTMGALMASFWVYFGAGIVLLLLQNISEFKRAKTGASHQVALKETIREMLLPAFLSLGVMGGGVGFTTLLLTDEIKPVDAPLKVALLQGNIAQELKFSQEQYYSILMTYLNLTDSVAGKADLVIWPETAVPSLYDQETQLGEHLRALSQESGTIVMTGIFSGNGATVRNSIVTYSDTFKSRDQRYDKAHLVPFGEFIPFRSVLNLFEGVIEIPFSDITKGSAVQAPFVLRSGKNGALVQASASICYEAVFGDELRYQGESAHFLVNVSNDAWFGDSIGPWQHFQIARARAIELQREMVRSTNNGITALINASGQVEAMLPQFEEGVLEVMVTPVEGVTAYVRLGDAFWALLAGLMLLCAGAWHRWGIK